MSTALPDNIRTDLADNHNLRRRRQEQPPEEQPSPPESDTVDGIDTILKDKEAYRSILRFQGPQAQRILDGLQTTLDRTVQCSDIWKHGVVALQRLSVRTDLFPSLHELRGVKKLEEESVSSGGYGEVYRGEYKEEMVCIKMLRINQKEKKKIKKFYAREAILWAQLSHENILPFYGVCTLDSKPCLVSPWEANGNVIEYLEKNPHADRLALVQGLTEGLRYLHTLGIVHGDLKAANVLVDSQDCARLTDFGLSSVYDQGILYWTTQSAPASTGGTVRWLAPELLQEAGLTRFSRAKSHMQRQLIPGTSLRRRCRAYYHAMHPEEHKHGPTLGWTTGYGVY